MLFAPMGQPSAYSIHRAVLERYLSNVIPLADDCQNPGILVEVARQRGSTQFGAAEPASCEPEGEDGSVPGPRNGVVTLEYMEQRSDLIRFEGSTA